MYKPQDVVAEPGGAVPQQPWLVSPAADLSLVKLGEAVAAFQSDAGPAKVGAALSMEARAHGARSCTLRRLGNGGSSISDYIGVCTSAACFCLSVAPTSGMLLFL